ncbi:MAG TPA: TonB family protein [Polyangia bacterium]|jgi:protein TonB|nr:TonB family protein [Polyangia bacterium]
MRLSLSIFVALACHGAFLGVMTAMVALAPRARPPLADVELEVIAAKPDPTTTAAAPHESASRPAPVPMHLRQVRHQSTPARAVPIDEAAAAVVAQPIVTAPTAPTAPVAAKRADDHPLASSGAVLIARPRYRTNPVPEYPLASRRRREEGIVLLTVAVDASGAPMAISLSHTSGHRLLDQAAFDAVRRWTFEPARAAGVPMLSTVTVPVRFALSDDR